MSLKNSTSGYSVRDILDLPDTSDEGSVTEDTEDEADEGSDLHVATNIHVSLRVLMI